MLALGVMAGDYVTFQIADGVVRLYRVSIAVSPPNIRAHGDTVPRPIPRPKPVVAKCGGCGGEGLIIPLPLPNGSFQCPNCNVPFMARPVVLAAIERAKADS